MKPDFLIGIPNWCPPVKKFLPTPLITDLELKNYHQKHTKLKHQVNSVLYQRKKLFTEKKKS